VGGGHGAVLSDLGIRAGKSPGRERGAGAGVDAVLDDRQRRNLERYTRYHLAIANQTI
jgi:hypothetical protein